MVSYGGMSSSVNDMCVLPLVIYHMAGTKSLGECGRECAGAHHWEGHAILALCLAPVIVSWARAWHATCGVTRARGKGRDQRVAQ